MRASTKVGIAGVAGLMAALAPATAGAGDKVSLCHFTGSDTNPVVVIDVSENAVPAHLANGDTYALASKGGGYFCLFKKF